MEKPKKKKNKFKKFLKKYIILWVILTIISTIYVFKTLKKFEKNQVENYMEALVEELKIAGKKKKIDKYINEINVNKSEFESENVSIEEGLNKLLTSSENVTYKLNENSKDELKPVYDIYVNDYKIFETELDGTKTETKLSLLTYSNWKTNYINVEADNGFLKYEISAPSNYDIYINGKKLTEDQISDSNKEEGLAEISKYVSIPYSIKYEVDGLIIEPNVKIFDTKGNEVKLSDIKIEQKIIKCDTIEEASKEIKDIPDILEIAENWSKFLSKDLAGTKYGFYTISKYLIKDSYLYNYAYNWATNIDITFISNHTLKDPAFTNEEITNFEIYNEKAFSCEVYLDKNMRLARGTDLTDTMNEKMYFAYYDDTDDNTNNPSWKLVNMQSVTKNK